MRLTRLSQWLFYKQAKNHNTNQTHNPNCSLHNTPGLQGILDTEIEVSEKGLVRKAQIMKQRGLPGKGDDIHFKLSIVEMGTTKWGKIASTCVVEFDLEPAESEPEEKGHAKKIRFLTDAWIDSGKPMERNKPYVSRPALKQAIEDNGYSAVRNQMMLQSQYQHALSCQTNLLHQQLDSYQHGE